ncbi:MAG: hypothetical protein RL839_04145 [Gammaproteobacteria bacterium]
MALNLSQKQAKQLAFWISFLALGIPYWIQPYDQLTLPNSLFSIGTPVMMLSALCLRGFFKVAFSDALLITGSVAPVTVLIRIVVEVFLLPDSHNLWPFELLIACLFGLIIATIGVLAGSLIARVRKV